MPGGEIFLFLFFSFLCLWMEGGDPVHSGGETFRVLGGARRRGRRVTEAVVLTGSVVRIWGALERVLSRHEHSLSRSDRTMRVLRVDLDEGRALVGVLAVPSPSSLAGTSRIWHLGPG